MAAWGQPVVSAIRNAATNLAPDASSGLAPQMLVAIVGENLATAAGSASYPWPKQLVGSTVTFNGTAAALAYASPSQINAVVPSALDGSANATVVVTTSAGSSTPVTVPIAPSAIGVFTQDMSGCGQAVALNVHADGTVSLNTPQNSLDPEKDWGLTVFLTGVGAFPDRTDGVPWQFNPADNRPAGGGANGVNAFFGIPDVGSYAPPLTVTYAGPMPSQSGVDQANLALSTDPYFVSAGRAPEGCRVPLYLDNVFSASQVVQVSIHTGGGACSDSPANSLGLVTWQQNIVSDVTGSSSSNSVTMQFLQGPGLRFLPTPAPASGGGPVMPQPSFCAAAYPATLGAGAITVSGDGMGPLPLQAQTQNGILSYQAPLPHAPGGNYSVSSAGSTPGVGPFTATLSIPPPITITNSLAPGTSVSAPFTLNWTGGDARSVITVQYISTSDPLDPYPLQAMLNANASGSAGTVTLSQLPMFFGVPSPPLMGSSAEIIVTQQPAAAPSQAFPAPGLSLGGEQTWKYVWHFRGLANQPRL